MSIWFVKTILNDLQQTKNGWKWQLWRLSVEPYLTRKYISTIIVEFLNLKADLERTKISQSPNVSKWGNCLNDWSGKKVRIWRITCVICIPGDSTITMIKNNSKFLQLLCLIRPRTLENVCFLIQKFRFEARREDPQESSGVWSHFLCKPMVRGGARITFESIKRSNSSHI